MRSSAHSERQSAFEKMLSEQGFLHGKCKRGAPWQNGIVEGSHRADNEELFQRIRFATSEDRSYQLRLWEHEYNNHRPPIRESEAGHRSKSTCRNTVAMPQLVCYPIVSVPLTP